MGRWAVKAWHDMYPRRSRDAFGESNTFPLVGAHQGVLLMLKMLTRAFLRVPVSERVVLVCREQASKDAARECSVRSGRVLWPS